MFTQQYLYARFDYRLPTIKVYRGWNVVHRIFETILIIMF